MKAKDIRVLTTDQVLEKGEQYKGELFDLHFQQATDQLESIARSRQIRKSITRIKTVLSEKELSKNWLMGGSY